MIILILLFVTRAFGAQTSPNDDKSVLACIGDQRTVLNIIWSCLATIFACTWLAVHPNVPCRDITRKGAISCAIERAKIMAITVLAPEVIVAWAAEQFIVAWKLTLAHGFLLSMGGFYYARKYTIHHQALDAHRAASTPPSSIFPWSIKDKSKGDALSNTISILQLSWFIVQCIARALQHLPITLLEIIALAFTGLSIIMYALWWYKPLNVKYHISLDGSEWPETNDPEKSASPVSPSWAKRASYRSENIMLWTGHTTLGVPGGEFRGDIGHAAIRFYSGTTEELLKRFLTMDCVGSLFAAFHFAAWSFYFPSHAEMVLWRFSCTAVLIGVFASGNYSLIGITVIVPWVKFLRLISFLMMPVGIVVYIIARIMLIILAFLQLRSLPPFAFCTVQWTTHIPHI
ncbi:hypothetical protein ARMGADRAFT_1129129 [Armillaria gallica]|uniref:Uncharacterized protein n=1 Tax=Armillaria gallica TaxID=47427 RepID=A0A2H3CRA8_ARMGA|nr:hypothetical protein ARMGADRAFT_1129129 [Armillaria gallica]